MKTETRINKSDILNMFGVASLSDVRDEDLIKLAEDGKLGHQTRYAATTSRAFSDTHALVDKIREAVENGKELCVVYFEGGWFSNRSVEICLHNI